jgi:hypothetical protein
MIMPHAHVGPDEIPSFIIKGQDIFLILVC